MNDELLSKHNSSAIRKSLDERLAHCPEFVERLHELTDALEQSVAEGMSADEAEGRFIVEMRKLGQALMNQWASQANEKLEGQVPREKPEAIRHAKKNFGGKPPSELSR